MRTTAVISALSAAAGVLGHAGHGNDAHRNEGEGLDWATRHMLVEHHFDTFDPGSFFIIHDFDHSQTWTHDEILRTYGINPMTGRAYDETGHEASDITHAKREEIVNKVLELMDLDHDGAITKEEFQAAWGDGVRLPDFGLGTGHHGDDEYEYEIHHFEKYHGDSDEVNEEDLNHPEDIAHFKKHEEDQAQQDKWEAESHVRINENNIPVKFRVQRPKQH
ncbi:hypothetical protein DRE_02782 [Drechslerella stenobrocha 248]|uniref:EF-hand domain-containing protein n=1 Tax=Drechslerella stenobrocha 248 TaxID=1043628 RepID=W7IFH0_9PEZI|nr:hypothetical protein DRE_02782 [Drechslerella stenobrocha 248]